MPREKDATDPGRQGVPAGVASRTLEGAVTNLVQRYGFTVVVAAAGMYTLRIQLTHSFKRNQLSTNP